MPPIYQAKRPNTSMELVWKQFEVTKAAPTTYEGNQNPPIPGPVCYVQ
jgi:hypothetical protein